MNWLLQILLFVGVLVVLKAVGLPISITGSVVLTVVLSLIMMMFQRRSYR
jgi:hypothetical protein